MKKRLLTCLIVIGGLFFIIKTYSYDISMLALTRVSLDYVEEMIEEGKIVRLYIGRKTCPYCVEVAPILAGLSMRTGGIYYLDSSIESEELMMFRDKYNIEFVPTLLVITNGAYEDIDLSMKYQEIEELIK